MTAGIVCEYNPLHNGHLFHIEKTKAAGADHIVCVMSGNFVQRGECACIDKWSRAKAAVECGADVVVDLPVPWAMSSAESFARGSISLLSRFNIDFLSFGCETENKELLMKCACHSENEEMSSLLKEYMSQGMNYPSALTKAVEEKLGSEAAEIITSPNSTLAVEYVRQMKKYLPDCEILPIKRMGAEHDSDEQQDGFASASGIRKLIGKKDVSGLMPSAMYNILSQQFKSGKAPCRTELAERAILSCLRGMNKDELSLYVTDKTGLADRIYNSVRTAESLEELYDNTKSKNYTHSRVRREIMNAYLGIENNIHLSEPPFVRVLAVSEKGLALLKNVKDMPLITKHSDACRHDSFAERVYEIQCSTTDKFALMSPNIRPCGMEQKNSMVIVR